MTYLVVGFVFVLLNLNFTIGIFTIGLLPDFVGYLLLLFGARQLEGHSWRFGVCQSWVIAMLAVSAVDYAFSLFGINALMEMNLIGWLLRRAFSALLTAGGLYCAYQIVEGVMELVSGAQEGLLYPLHLRECWKALAVTQALGWASTLIALGIFSLLITLALLVVVILFLIQMQAANRLWRLRETV